MVEFNKETHTYFSNGKKVISVTQLLGKHGLAKNYDGVPEMNVKRAGEKGTLVHEEIEHYLKTGVESGYITELYDFQNMCKEIGFTPEESEKMFVTEDYAGTIDCIGTVDGVKTVVDFKTANNINLETCRWQLSLYARAVGAGRIFVFHLSDKATEWIELDLIPADNIERLLECERNGEIFKTGELSVDLVEAVQKAEKNFADAEKEYKMQKELRDGVLNKIKEAMEAEGLKSVETELLKITYVDASTRTSVDAKALEQYEPDVFEKFKKITNVKPSIRVKLKGETK